MTQPVLGRYRVDCGSCGATAYLADTPPADGREELRRFADTQCPRGGVGCPHLSATQDEQEKRRPEQLRRRIQELREELRDATTALTSRVDALAARRPTTRISAPLTIPVMTTDTTWDLSVTWSPPMPSTYEVTINEPRFVVTVTSQSPAGCALTLRATSAVPAVSITVVAAGWA